MGTKNNEHTIGIEGLYVVHALVNKERKRRLEKTLVNKYGLDVEFVSDGDISFFTDELLNKYFTQDTLEKLTKAQISCTLNHIMCYQKILNNKNEYALILEDDALFLGNFKNNILTLLPEIAKLPKNFMITIETTTFRRVPSHIRKKGKHIYPAKGQKCTGGYIIDKAFAETIIKHLGIEKCSETTDWWHNELIKKGIFNMYWAEPPFVEQGSHSGVDDSLIARRKKKSLTNRFKYIMKKNFRLLIPKKPSS